MEKGEPKPKEYTLKDFKNRKITQETGKNPYTGKIKMEFLKSIRNINNLHNTTGQEVDEKNINKAPDRHKVFRNIFVLCQDTMSFSVLPRSQRKTSTLVRPTS